MTTAQANSTAPAVDTDSTLEILAQHKIPFRFNPFVDSIYKQMKKVGEEIREQARYPLYMNIVDQLLPPIKEEVLNFANDMDDVDREKCLAMMAKMQLEVDELTAEVNNCRTGGISVSTVPVSQNGQVWEYIFHVRTPGRERGNSTVRVIERKPVREFNKVINLSNVRCQPGEQSFKDESSSIKFAAEIRARPEDFERGMELARENYYAILNCDARFIYRRVLSMAFALGILDARESIQLGGEAGININTLDANADRHRKKNSV
jgi:hypothetical protein